MDGWMMGMRVCRWLSMGGQLVRLGSEIGAVIKEGEDEDEERKEGKKGSEGGMEGSVGYAGQLLVPGWMDTPLSVKLSKNVGVTFRGRRSIPQSCIKGPMGSCDVIALSD